MMTKLLKELACFSTVFSNVANYINVYRVYKGKCPSLPMVLFLYYFFKIFLNNSPSLGQKNNMSKSALAGEGKITHLGSRKKKIVSFPCISLKP